MSNDHDALRAQLGRLGVWTFQLDVVPMGRAQEVAAELESMGYSTLWTPEAMGREAMTSSALLLAGTTSMTVATGIASIWARDAMATAGAHKTLTDAFGSRFVLGLGVSHQPAVEQLRQQQYARPYRTMVDYLDRMDASLYLASPPDVTPRRLLAALGPKMLRLAAERADGAHPYFVPPEHTVMARGILGPEPVLAVEQAVLLETDPSTAREVARAHMRMYTGLPNYVGNLRRLGFGDDDFASGGSDRLVDAIVAWGTMETVMARVQAHFDAGADHVCVQVITADLAELPFDSWRAIAAA